MSICNFPIVLNNQFFQKREKIDHIIICHHNLNIRIEHNIKNIKCVEKLLS